MAGRHGRRGRRLAIYGAVVLAGVVAYVFVASLALSGGGGGGVGAGRDGGVVDDGGDFISRANFVRPTAKRSAPSRSPSPPPPTPSSPSAPPTPSTPARDAKLETDDDDDDDDARANESGGDARSDA